MTDGKLVRDLVPELIRRSGRHVEVRHLSGDELMSALGAKLQEEAQEAAESIGNREGLIDELADISEVISLLMKINEISDDHLAQAVKAKALERGQFTSGALLVSAVPNSVRRLRVSDVDAHRVNWIPERWINAFKGHEAAHAELQAHSEKMGGIARSFIHDHADGDPVDLFLMAMAWGYGRTAASHFLGGWR